MIQSDAIVKRHQADCAAQRTSARADCPSIWRPVHGIILVNFRLSSNGDLQDYEMYTCIRDDGMLLGYAKLRIYVYAGKIY